MRFGNYDVSASGSTWNITVQDSAATDITWIYGVPCHIEPGFDFVTTRIKEIFDNRKRLIMLKKTSLLHKPVLSCFQVRQNTFNKFNKEANKR